MLDKEMPFVSVVLPVRNEGGYIARCLDSVLLQDYAPNKLEIFLVDGLSEDGTREIIRQYQARRKAIRLIDNVRKIVPVALNLGIDQAKGEYIIRMDAHAIYPQDYVSKCIEYAIKTGAENVGGVWETVGEGYVGEAIALALSSKFGVGNAKFRTEQFEGCVDTVPFGCFKRSVFDRIGKFNEKLARNQDIEFNSRIRRSGGKIYLTPEIRSKYYCRNTLAGLFKQNFGNGYWNVIAIVKSPGTLSWRHFVPFIFILSLLVLAGLSPFIYMAKGLLILDTVSYIVANLLFSTLAALKSGLKYLFIMPAVYAVLHFSYGAGSLRALISVGRIE
jgi:glycosyltransferase involved in cell wall biosynthesis